MNLKQLNLDELSHLRYSYSKTQENSVLIGSFSGSYGIGSLGNGDGIFISAVTLAGLAAFEGGCLVLDFSNMDYKWGNTLLKVFNDVSQYMNEPDAPAFPIIVVTSDRSRDAFLSLVGSTEEGAKEWHFQNMAEAIEAAQSAAQHWYDS